MRPKSEISLRSKRFQSNYCATPPPPLRSPYFILTAQIVERILYPLLPQYTTRSLYIAPISLRHSWKVPARVENQISSRSVSQPITVRLDPVPRQFVCVRSAKSNMAQLLIVLFLVGVIGVSLAGGVCFVKILQS